MVDESWTIADWLTADGWSRAGWLRVDSRLGTENEEGLKIVAEVEGRLTLTLGVEGWGDEWSRDWRKVFVAQSVVEKLKALTDLGIVEFADVVLVSRPSEPLVQSLICWLMKNKQPRVLHHLIQCCTTVYRTVCATPDCYARLRYEELTQHTRLKIQYFIIIAH